MFLRFATAAYRAWPLRPRCHGSAHAWTCRLASRFFTAACPPPPQG